MADEQKPTRTKAKVAEAKAVLFHCQAGINRSAALAVAALCVHEQRPFLRVLRDSLQRRPGMLQNRSFKRQLIHCIRTEGPTAVEHYQKQVHQVFQLFAQDNSADFDLFKELLHEAFLLSWNFENDCSSHLTGLFFLLLAEPLRTLWTRLLLSAGDSGDSDDGDRRRRRQSKSGESEQEQLTKKLMPNLVRFVTEDQRALQDACELLSFFVQRHFPDNKELADLAKKPSPKRLFKQLLGALERELGKEEKDSDEDLN
eukprot:g10089.t1